MTIKQLKLSHKLILNDTNKSREKFKAIQAFEMGTSVSEIARSLHKSRLTIYRWLHGAHAELSQRKKTPRKNIDGQSENKIIEVYILLKKPSMRKLNTVLHSVFGIKVHPAKLRRFLIKRGLWSWEPSAYFDLIHQSLASKNSQ